MSSATNKISSAIPAHLKPQIPGIEANGAAEKHHGKSQSHVVS